MILHQERLDDLAKSVTFSKLASCYSSHITLDDDCKIL